MTFYFFTILVIILTSGAQIFLKMGAQNKNDLSSIFLNYYTIAGYFIMVLVTIFTVLALKEVDLKLLYALTSLNYVLVILLSKVVLKEKVRSNKLIAIVLIVIGVIIFNA